MRDAVKDYVPDALLIQDRIQLGDHERRLRVLEGVNTWSLLTIAFLIVLQWFGIGSLANLLKLLGGHNP